MTRIDLLTTQLFLDDSWIEDSAFVTRVWHPAQKHPEPILCAEHPWERWCPVTYGTVLHWRGMFRMWYCTWIRESRLIACYAQSQDGIIWEKPKLGLHEWNGNRDNNIILSGLIDNLSVIEDPDDEEWPLKMLFWDGVDGKYNPANPWGIFAARSADGIHWDLSPGNVLPQWGDRFNAAPTRINGKFLGFGRAPFNPAHVGLEGTHDKGRTVFRVESEDFRHWSQPRLVLACDTEDPAAMQTYSTTAFEYEGTLLGGMERMHVSPDVVDTELTWSNDEGLSWQRARTRPAFLAPGISGSWDDTWVNLATNAPILRHDRLWFYYSGRSGAHGAPYPSNKGAIGLAFLRRDGFASIQAGEAPGYLQTPLTTWPDGDLHINCDPRRDIRSHPRHTGGQVDVEIRTEDNKPVPGYSFADCNGVRENTAALPLASAKVSWKAGKSTRDLAGRGIRLVFRLRDSHLYSFRAQ